jgi:putative lipase involved disintegration of autophagic bodies
MITLKRSLAMALVCLALSIVCLAQIEQRFDFYTRGEYRTNVPRPQAILRYDVGDFHTTYAQMEQVMNAIASAAPDRV